jgi:hypothetical protein
LSREQDDERGQSVGRFWSRRHSGMNRLLGVLLLALLELERLDEPLGVKVALIGRLESMENRLELVERRRLRARAKQWEYDGRISGRAPRIADMLTDLLAGPVGC